MNPPPPDNQTDFQVHPQLLLTREGERLVVMVKATFELDPATGTFNLPEEDFMRPLRFADVPWGEPDVSSVLYPADICPFKPGTDVFVVAKAFAPRNVATPTFDVLVNVGPLEKAVRVFGLRVWEANGAGLSAPRPVSEVELRYENAWGGFDDSDPEAVVEEPRNPVGLGVARNPADLTHRVAPCLEDPAVPIQNHRTRPPPASVGAIGRHWMPRRQYVGTYDDAWKETRAPLPPRDFDDRAYLCASPGLIATPPLRGGELVRLLGVVPNGGAVQFTVPIVGIELEFDVKDREPEIQRPFLDTLLIDTLIMTADRPLTLELVWRGSIRPPRKLADAHVTVREVQPS